MTISFCITRSCCASLASSSYACRRALFLACRARGAMRTHSSSRCSVFCRARRLLLFLRQALLLLLQPAGVVALVRHALAAIELEDPLGHVVQEVAIVRDRHDRAREALEDDARATPPTRRRGGWWVRRAAACPAPPAASRHSATRRFSPPDSVVTSASPGGRRSASIATSILLSRFHRSCWSMYSCSLPCLSISASKSASGSANFIEISLNSFSASRCALTASSTLPRTSSAGSSSGSCGR